MGTSEVASVDEKATPGHGAGHDHDGEHGHEDHGIGRYVGIFGALLCLTILTWWTGQQDWGIANLPVAMLIASVKATLVVLFFMHLYDESPVNKLVFVVSVFFAIVLMLGTFGDLWFRMSTLLPTGVGRW